jgi:hypothetical protein
VALQTGARKAQSAAVANATASICNAAGARLQRSPEPSHSVNRPSPRPPVARPRIEAMKTSAVTALAACAVMLACAAAQAADPGPPPPPAPPSASASAAVTVQTPTAPLTENAEVDRQHAGEPAIQRTVIEDRLSKVEELRVRGQLQKVTVDNKGRAPNYEVLTHDGARDIADGGIVGLGGAAGKRVWNVLRF